MNTRSLALGILGVAVLAAFGWLTQSNSEQARERMVHPERGPFRVTVTTTGELQARNSVEIDYEKAKCDYEQAVANYETKVKQARAQMRESAAQLTKAQNKLRELEALSENFTIRAPENGRVVYRRDRRGRKLTEGGTISPWNPVVATLPDLSVMQSITYVNEVDIQKVKAREPVEIGLDATPDKRLTGTVTSVANIGEERPNSDAKVFRVEIEISERDTTLRPAMTTSNTIVATQRDFAQADTVAACRFEVARNRYRVGNISITELFRAQTEKDAARRSYIQALRAFWASYYQLRRLTLYDFGADRTLSFPFE